MSETITQLNAINQHGTLPLQAESAQNTAAILDEAMSEFDRVGFVGPPEFDTEVQVRTEEIEAHQRTSINMMPASLGRMLSNGAHESAWSQLREAGFDNMHGSNTAQGKNFHDRYFEHRAAVESQLATYVEDPGKGEPIYAAVASNEQEHLHGACPQYGDIAVIIDEKTVNPDSTVYAWSDSLAGSLGRDEQNEITVAEPQVLTKGDAMTAKAVVDMLDEYNMRFPKIGGRGGLISPKDVGEEQLLSVRAGYIETVLFQDVTPDMVEAVSVSGSMENMAETLKVINTHPEIADKAIFVVQDGQPDMVKDYLATRFTVVEKSPGTETVKQRVVDPEPWKDLGVDPSSDPATIEQSLLNKTVRLLKSDTELSNLTRSLTANDKKYMNTARGMKQALNSLKSDVNCSSNERTCEQYKQALRLQEAVAFFESIATAA